MVKCKVTRKRLILDTSGVREERYTTEKVVSQLLLGPNGKPAEYEKEVLIGGSHITGIDLPVAPHVIIKA